MTHVCPKKANIIPIIAHINPKICQIIILHIPFIHHTLKLTKIKTYQPPEAPPPPEEPPPKDPQEEPPEEPPPPRPE